MTRLVLFCTSLAPLAFGFGAALCCDRGLLPVWQFVLAAAFNLALCVGAAFVAAWALARPGREEGSDIRLRG